MRFLLLYRLMYVVYTSLGMLSIFFASSYADIIEVIREQNIYNDIHVEQTFYDVDDSGVIDAPTVTITYPDDNPIIDVRGRIDPGTIRSVVAHTNDLQLCSRIARENIHMLTGLPYRMGLVDATGEYISQQDAIWLIKQGSGVLIPIPDTSLVSSLHNMHHDQGATLADVYIYTPRPDAATQYKAYIEQGHRVVFFLGTDGKWWVLDPLLGYATFHPQLASEYIASEEFTSSQRFVFPRLYTVADRDTQGTIDLEVVQHTPKHILRSQYPIPLYRRPSEKSPQVLTVATGEALEYLDDKDSWYHIRTSSGAIGWIPHDTVHRETYFFPRTGEAILTDYILLFSYLMYHTDRTIERMINYAEMLNKV